MQLRNLSLLLSVATALATAQSSAPAPIQTQQQVWQMQDSGTTAGLRGIDSVDGTVAWASGTEGTVLKTTDGGAHWTKCAVPDADKDGATLDFRGVQAWDATTAIVMASGPGDKSRLYKTTDGCKTWKLAFRNADKDGFWDALFFDRGQSGWLLGDPVNGQFSLFYSEDRGRTWINQRNNGLNVPPSTQGAFAASNSSLFAWGGFALFGTGGSGGANVFAISGMEICLDDCPPKARNLDGRRTEWKREEVPLGTHSEASGIFSIAARANPSVPSFGAMELIAVGGDYTKPNESAGTAARSSDSGLHWTAPAKPPHGYRSTVQWSESLKLWITAGTNGSDISRDDGRTWQPLDNGNWNALSLPFIIGPKGRIGRLDASAIPKGN